MFVCRKRKMGYRNCIVLTQSSSVLQARFQHTSIPEFQHSVILWDDCVAVMSVDLSEPPYYHGLLWGWHLFHRPVEPPANGSQVERHGLRVTRSVVRPVIRA